MSGMVYGKVLWDSAVRGIVPSLIDMTADAEFPVASLTDWKTYTKFRVGTVTGSGGTTCTVRWTLAEDATFDSFAWALLDPGDVDAGSTHKITLQKWDGVAATTLLTVDLFVDGLLGLRTFTEETVPAGDAIQIVVSSTKADFSDYPWDFLQVAVGACLDFPIGQRDGLSPPMYQKAVKASNPVASRGSIFLREAVRANLNGSIELDYLQESFASGDWLNFLRHAEALGFFYAWDYATHQRDVVLAHAVSISSPKNSSPNPLMQSMLSWVAPSLQLGYWDTHYVIDEYRNPIIDELNNNLVGAP